MKIFVMADMEGISGIFHRSQTGRAEPYFEVGRRYLTDDVNACVAGCVEGGARAMFKACPSGNAFRALPIATD